MVSDALSVFARAFTDAWLDSMRGSGAIVPYLDMPMQHASDAVARADAPSGAEENHPREGARGFVDAVPDSRFARRASSAFPARPRKTSDLLVISRRSCQFERVGVFTYSAQEGTRAAEFADDVPARSSAAPGSYWSCSARFPRPVDIGRRPRCRCSLAEDEATAGPMSGGYRGRRMTWTA